MTSRPPLSYIVERGKALVRRQDVPEVIILSALGEGVTVKESNMNLLYNEILPVLECALVMDELANI